MAVRTNQAGVKNKRQVDPRNANASTGASNGKRKSKVLPRDEAALLRREKSLAAMKPGPAANRDAHEYDRGRIPSTVAGRKKAPSQMKLQRKGGPFKRSRLHGG
jgi:hypothetical protein